MSAPINSKLLDNIFASVGGSSYGVPTFGAGSGSTNFLNGLNLDSLFGGSSSAGNGLFSSSSLNTLSSLLGAPGLGFVTNLIPGFQGFLDSGFDFTCLGSQAFNKENLDSELNQLKTKGESVQGSGGGAMGAYLDYVINVIHTSNIEIGKYKSGCSKSLRGKLRDSAQQIYDSVNKDAFNLIPSTGTNWDGQTFPTTTHQFKGGSIPDISLDGMTFEQFETTIKPELQKYALQNGLDFQTVYETVKNKIFPDGGINGSGGVVLNPDGSIDWGISVGNQKPPNYLLYVISAVGLFFGYKMLKKK